MVEPSAVKPSAAKPSVLMLFSGIGLYGSERANLEVASALQRQGFKVRIVVSSAWWGAEMRDHLTKEGFEFVAMPFLLIDQTKSIRGWLKNLFRVCDGSLRLLRECWKMKPDFLLCGTQLSLLSFLPALCFLTTPLVYRSGDAPILHNRVFRLSWRLLLWKGYRFVAVSQFIRSRMIEHKVPAQFVQVIFSKPPGRTIAQGTPVLEPTLHSEKVSTDSFVVAYVGQIREQKGVGLLAEAILSLVPDYPQLQLKIAGRVSDWAGDQWAARFKQQILEHQLGDHVTFLGFIEDVPRLIGSSDVVVVPTLTQEPLANVVFESKLASKPVIIFKSGGLPEVISHDVDGFICEEKTMASLKNALQRYLDDGAMTIRHGQASRASLDDFGMSRFDQDWAEVFIGEADG